jgi:acetyl-CoA carboxylase biotin carboxyl carrier protein
MPSSQPFNKEFIQELAKMLADCDLTEIEIEHDKSKLRVAREIKQTVYAPMQQAYPMNMPHYNNMAQASAGSHTDSSLISNNMPADTHIKGEQVTSPMVGTVYLSPDPESPPFIKVGDSIERGQTIMIVEAMKVMNNIPAPKSGIVKAIKVSDKEPVEFGQLLVIID